MNTRNIWIHYFSVLMYFIIFLALRSRQRSCSAGRRRRKEKDQISGEVSQSWGPQESSGSCPSLAHCGYFPGHCKNSPLITPGGECALFAVSCPSRSLAVWCFPPSGRLAGPSLHPGDLAAVSCLLRGALELGPWETFHYTKILPGPRTDWENLKVFYMLFDLQSCHCLPQTLSH